MKFQKGSLRKSLRYSMLDGLFTAAMLGVSEYYLIPYAIAVGAQPSQVGLIAGVPPLVAALLQVRSAGVTERLGSRLKLICSMVFFHALSWLPILGVAFLACQEGFGPMALAPWVLLLAVTLFSSFGAFSVPAWQSLMSDYIPTKKRGLYFGRRNRLQGILTVSVSISAGLLLNRFGKDSLAGFVWLFALAMLCRFLALACLQRMVEPPRHTSHDEYFSFLEFVRRIRTSPFAKFVLFVSLMNASVSLSGPLLAVFMLQDLGYSYTFYMIAVTTAALSGFLFMSIFGPFGDRIGNIRVLKVAGWGIALIPALWMVSQHIVYVALVQFFAGAVWGGFNLLVQNFMMEAVPPQRRIRSISYFNVVNAAAVLVGAFIGGRLFHQLPPLFGYSYLSLFLLSCCLRSAVMIGIAPHVREVRQ